MRLGALGHFLMSPDNALRDIDEENYLKETHKLVDELKVELKGQHMTHKQFVDMMKKRGIHRRFYHYKKYENNCPICRYLGIR